MLVARTLNLLVRILAKSKANLASAGSVNCDHKVWCKLKCTFMIVNYYCKYQ
jgi:hypothetical protein